MKPIPLMPRVGGAQRAAPRWLTCAAALFAAVLSGCGGSGSPAVTAVPITPAPAEVGDVQIAITDAEGDFVSYTVELVSLLLERANGDLVETLPLATRVDFTELTEVTELLSVATVPAGHYVSATLALDFNNAKIVVQDESGADVAAAPVDADGNALGIVDLTLSLDNAEVIRVAPGVPAAFSLDFDLDASNAIDLGTSPPKVTVEPILLASAELEADREHRVRGVLINVDQSAAELTLRVRPFRHRSGDFGRFTLQVNDDTVWEVDGVGYLGADGLAAIASLPATAPVVANGLIIGSVANRTMLADTVIAGSSVPWTDGDVARGLVVARNGNQLSVHGTRIEYRDGIEVFRGAGTVLVGPGTAVTAPGVGSADLSIDSISVGQRIVAFGTLVDDRTIDVSDGRVRMTMNQLTAAVVTPQPLAVDLYYLNGRRPAMFDFSGTGVDASLDADPDSYDIDAGALDTTALSAGDLVRVRGLVSDFGSAPADFVARTIVDVGVEDRPASLTVAWNGGTAMPFFDVTAQQIAVDLGDSREFMRVRGVPRDLTNPLQGALLQAPDDGVGVYAVAVRGEQQLHAYRNFADLATELDAQLDAGRALHRITAHGTYDPDSAQFVARRASFFFRTAADE